MLLLHRLFSLFVHNVLNHKSYLSRQRCIAKNHDDHGNQDMRSTMSQATMKWKDKRKTIPKPWKKRRRWPFENDMEFKWDVSIRIMFFFWYYYYWWACVCVHIWNGSVWLIGNVNWYGMALTKTFQMTTTNKRWLNKDFSLWHTVPNFSKWNSLNICHDSMHVRDR